ncbi:hypothetical protein L1987_84529 [Smallanthus sonchifolius]|uniref:Uncharacterized protein n=1 Tax=Smallanthus sonchifolius TaxID=185202 RepID=A0ACB8YFL2_9ASTR|nr:hypothetical protein L1987_84529 [Smallanthus sonchifolius]
MATIQHLNTIILSRGSLESSKLAASLICSLAMLDKNKAVFGVSNTIQALLKAVSRPKGPVTRHLLSSLAELAHFHGNCTLAVRSSAVNVLLRIVKNEDCKDLSGTALAILELLARFDEGLKALINTPNLVSTMLDVLKGRCMMTNEGASEVLILVLDESEECLKEAMRLLDLMFVLADLSVRGSTRAREKASLLLKKLEANELYAEDNLVFLKWPSWLRGADFGQSRWQKWGSSGKKEKSMAGDWVCGTCQRHNFHWRTKCRRCNEPFVSLSQVQICAPVPRVRNFRPGDWFCDAGLLLDTITLFFLLLILKSLVKGLQESVGEGGTLETGFAAALTAMHTIMVPESNVTSASRRGIWLAMFLTNFVASKVSDFQGCSIDDPRGERKFLF